MNVILQVDQVEYFRVYDQIEQLICDLNFMKLDSKLDHFHCIFFRW